MSRIFEALQKADLERKTASAVGDNEATHAEAMAGVEETSQARADIELESITQHRWRPSIASLPTLADRGAGVEQFRSLRSHVYQARYEAPMKTILISSGMPSEGKTFVAANLAMSLARNSASNILLIDGDLRRPTLHSLLGAPDGPGLSEYLQGAAGVKDILQRNRSSVAPDSTSVDSLSNLTFIPAGKCGDDSSELVANHRIEELIATVSPHFDWILIDSPPVLAVTDAVQLAHAADAVLLIAREASTTYTVAQNTQAIFSSSRILGFVLNDVKETPRSGYSYYNHSGAPKPAGRTKQARDLRG